jgi:hypothetical protein
LISLALVAVVSACTNSKLIISPLYNQLDDRIRKQFHELADFNNEQTAAFEASLGTYHVWHRQAELPQYATLLRDIAAAIENQSTSQANVEGWMQRVEAHSRAARECHPINYSFDLVRTLSDDQLNAIEQRFLKRRAENRQRYESRTAEERVQRRLNNMDKWAGRLNLELTDEQRSILRSAFTRQKSLRAQYYQLSAQWNTELFDLARNQSHPDYNRAMQQHFEKLWSLLESNHAEQWQQNRELWQGVIFDVEQSMTRNQRLQFSRWIARLATTLDSVSRVTPSFKVGNDPTVGCLVPADERQTLG